MAVARAVELSFTTPELDRLASENIGRFIVGVSDVQEKSYADYIEDQKLLISKPLIVNPPKEQVSQAIIRLDRAIADLSDRVASGRESLDSLNNAFINLADNELEEVKGYLPTVMHYESMIRSGLLGATLIKHKPNKFPNNDTEKVYNATKALIELNIKCMRHHSDEIEALSKPLPEHFNALLMSKIRLREVQAKIVALEDAAQKNNDLRQNPNPISVTKINNDSPSLSAQNPPCFPPGSARVSDLTFINNKRNEPKEHKAESACCLVM